MKALVLFISAIFSAAHGRTLIYNQGTLNPGLKTTLHHFNVSLEISKIWEWAKSFIEFLEKIYILSLGFDSERAVGNDTKAPLEFCNGCTIMNAVDLELVQVFNVHRHPNSTASTTSKSESPVGSRQRTTTSKSDGMQKIDLKAPPRLPDYMSSCNGCFIYQASAIQWCFLQLCKILPNAFTFLN